MKKFVVVAVMLGLGLSAFAGDKERKEMTSLFGVVEVPKDSTYNLITGIGEGTLGHLWAKNLADRMARLQGSAKIRSKMQELAADKWGPKGFTEGQPSTFRNAAEELRARRAFLESMKGNKGFAGIISGFRVIGEGAMATYLIYDGYKRAYEWTEAGEFRRAPEYEFMSKATGVKLEDLPLTLEEEKAEAELKRDEEAFHGVLQEKSDAAKQKRAENKKDYTRRNEEHKAQQKLAHEAASARTTTQDMRTLALGTLKATGAVALLKSALARTPNPVGDSLKKAENLLDAVNRTETTEQLGKQAANTQATIDSIRKQIEKDNLEIERISKSHPNLVVDTANGHLQVDTSADPKVLAEIARIEQVIKNRQTRIGELEALIKKLSETRSLTNAMKQELRAMVESEVSSMREVHARSAMKDVRLEGWKVIGVVGGVLLVADVAGHVIEWKATKDQASFSPLLSYMFKHGPGMYDSAVKATAEGIQSLPTEEVSKVFESFGGK